MRKKTIIIVFSILSIGLIFFLTLTKINFLDYEKPIPYEKIDEITFKNFRGLEFFRESLYGNKAFAYVNTTIDTEFVGDSISVEAFFHPAKSYVYNKKVYSKDLLTHEMYHFKITELHARILKQKISEMKLPTKNEIKEVILLVENQESIFQRKYDDDTFHSYVLSQQKKYEKKIDSLLHLYETFKEPKIQLK